MIRETLPSDTDVLCRLADETKVFYDYEITTLREVLDDYHSDGAGHVAITIEDSGTVAGFAYYGEAEMTDRTWELWWIVVDPARHGRGLGKQLMNQIEADVRLRKGRLLLIETSSLERYEPTRQFYLKLGYVEAARIPEYYTTGDDKVIFWKKL